jgi:hypothetical protein
MKKMRAIVLILGLAIAVLPARAQQQLPPGMTPSKQLIFQLLNQHRAENGLAPLTWDPALARAAQAHAQVMAQQGGTGIEHQYPGEADLMTRTTQAGAHFGTVAENIAATSGRLTEIDDGWMHSPGHRANILNPQFTAVGIAIVQGQGLTYAVEDFARGNVTAGPGQIEAQAIQILQSHGFQLDTSDAARKAARNSCDSTSAAPDGVMSAMQFNTTDLNQLPASILKAMPGASEHKLAVGACPAGHSQGGLAMYHVAVLMFGDGQ